MELSVRPKIGKAENQPYEWSDLYGRKQERSEIDRTNGELCTDESMKGRKWKKENPARI